ncbi:MAG: hypothetical protein LW870_08385 [Pirellula sp.]|nr:hypothetical protein [Pirellula sp.]
MRLLTRTTKRLLYSLDVFRLLIRKYGVFGLYTLIKDDVLFDYRYGVDTYSSIDKEDLFTGERLALQNRYFPSTFGLIDLAIEEARNILGEDIRHCHLLDYGLGKGKVLIGAVKNGFEVARGVEYTALLHRVAVRNLEKLKILRNAKSIQARIPIFADMHLPSAC